MNTNHNIIRTEVVAVAASSLLAAAPGAVGADNPRQMDRLHRRRSAVRAVSTVARRQLRSSR